MNSQKFKNLEVEFCWKGGHSRLCFAIETGCAFAIIIDIKLHVFRGRDGHFIAIFAWVAHSAFVGLFIVAGVKGSQELDGLNAKDLDPRSNTTRWFLHCGLVMVSLS
jgi:hypothetical protein